MQEFMASLAAGVATLNLSYLFAFIMGAFGALVKDISEDGALTLPAFKEGKFYIGFLGAVLIGAAAGLLTSGDILTEFLAGFVGLSVITSFVESKTAQSKNTHEEDTAIIASQITKNETKTNVATNDIVDIITKACEKYGINVSLGIEVATAESSLNPTAINKNTDSSIDRGLYQINSACHPEVTEEQAFNPTFAAEWFCQAVKDGHLSWWNSSKSRWLEKVVVA
jgi:hypothetical protein